MKNFSDLVRFAAHYNFVVTSTDGGAHNRGSKHFLGLAIDVRTGDKQSAEIELFMRRAKMLGIIVRDERGKPPHQKVWSGAHLHLEIGAQTPETVRQFQRVNKLTADGIAGAETLKILDSFA
jgi:Putative peptidoglycan binding domain